MLRSFALAFMLALVGVSFAGGALWHQRIYVAPHLKLEVPTLPRTLFHRIGSTDEQRRIDETVVEDLNALGYLRGYEEAPSTQGATLFDRARVAPGLNLYTSGHAPEAYLMDMEGTILHRWRYALEEIWPDDDYAPNYFRRAHVLDGGELLTIFEPVGLLKLDKDSNLIWSIRNGAHHDLSVDDDGTIHVLTQKVHPVLWFTDYGTVIEDFITELTPEGQIVREVSILECFRDSRYGAYLKRTKRAGDVLHSNALKVLDGAHAERSPAFQRGNYLVSVRELDVIAIIDPGAKEVVWALSGKWFRQHESTFLQNGNLLLFDNRGNKKKSKVIEFDPLTQEVVWTYGAEEDEPLYSSTCGAAARLPNGNTLITESNRGRAFEVTADKRIVWEYMSPHRAGEEGELIATLFDMVRLPAAFSLDWLQMMGAEGGDSSRLDTDVGIE